MRLRATYGELNNLVTLADMKMKFSSVSQGCFSLTYDPGVFLPNVTLRLSKHVLNTDYVVLKYESDSSFMLSAAQFFSALPDAVKLDTDNKKITIYPSQFDALKNSGKKLYFSSFDILPDALDLTVYFG